MLCVVNTRAHAQALFRAIEALPGAIHLTTLMCPRHRRFILADARRRLRQTSEPVRIVSTSLIEAGVDIDFPEVWRAATGLDSIAQAAGRCNREGRIVAGGLLVVFEPEGLAPPKDVKPRWQAARAVLDRHPDALDLAAIHDYFRELYFNAGESALEAFDTKIVDGKPGILRHLTAGAKECRFPFAAIAEAFRMIDDGPNATVIVPWRTDANDSDAEALLDRLAAQDRPFGGDLRRLRQYAVPIPKAARDTWLTAGVLRPVNPALGDKLLRFPDLAHYDSQLGVLITALEWRAPFTNII